MEQLKHVRTLTTSALLVAMGILLGLFKIPLSETIQIYFSFLAVAVSGFLYGPAIGFLVGALTDLGSFLVRPTGPFFIGFTLTAGLAGLIYGILLYKKEGTVAQIGIAQAVATIFSACIGNTLNLQIMYNLPFWSLVGPRFLKELIVFPLHTFLLVLVIRAV
ncbi:MAG: folate family ECF transporter S component, partial [Erysipelotrichaceae bacterium]|nr:folate family ECF transporter S component [Erysipelotrichaceae bacterium]